MWNTSRSISYKACRMREISTDPAFIALVFLFAACLAISAFNRRAIPLAWLSLVGRWARCGLFCVAAALVLANFLPEHPFPILLACGLAVFFLLETLLYWMRISVFNSDEYSECRRFRECENAWRPEPELIRLKGEIQSRGFRRVGSAKCSYGGEDLVLATLFESESPGTLLTVAFVPYGDIWRCCCSAESAAQDGTVVYTEASQAPFGLEYPKKYSARRLPLVSSPLKLLDAHAERLAQFGAIATPEVSTATEFLNARNLEIERCNRLAGLINPPSDMEFDGYLSANGKFLVWIDTIKINFFPFLVR